MFPELMPVLNDRSFTMTLSLIQPDNKIRVNVVPQEHQKKDPNVGYDDGAKAAKAAYDRARSGLNTPFSMTGTAAELDQVLPERLANYAQLMTELASTVDETFTDLEAAKKAADEAKKAISKIGKKEPPKPAAKAEVKTNPVPEEPSLFNTGTEATATATPEPAPTTEVPAPAPAPTTEVPPLPDNNAAPGLPYQEVLV